MPRYHVLVAHQSPEMLELLKDHLSKGGHSMTSASDEVTVLEKLEQLDDNSLPDCIFLGSLFYKHGIHKIWNKIKKDQRCQSIPVAVIMVLGSTEEKIEAIKNGVRYFLESPIEETIFLNEVENLGELNRLRKENHRLKYKEEWLRRRIYRGGINHNL